jgi:magnesium transporter
MIRILYRNDQGELDTHIQVEKLPEILKEPDGLLWIDMANVSIEIVEPILTHTFGFHPLAIDDALREDHLPKVDDWQDYLYIVLRAANYSSTEPDELQVPELDVFLGLNFIVTYYHEPIPAVDRVWAVCQRDQRWTKRGAGNLLYRLADELASEAVALVEDMQDELELIEDQLFADARPATPERLFTLKRNILQLRRIAVPQRDVLNKLSRNEYRIIDIADRIFFRDVYDHLLQLNNLLNDLIILVGGARDAYLSIVNNRMNDIVKTLTVITAFFMPLAFITGFFGMNFFQAATPYRAWTSESALIIALAAMVLIPLVMYLWMRHRSWI